MISVMLTPVFLASDFLDFLFHPSLSSIYSDTHYLGNIREFGYSSTPWTPDHSNIHYIGNIGSYTCVKLACTQCVRGKNCCSCLLIEAEKLMSLLQKLRSLAVEFRCRSEK